MIGKTMMLEVRELWTYRNLMSLEDTLAYLRNRWYWYKQDRQNKEY